MRSNQGQVTCQRFIKRPCKSEGIHIVPHGPGQFAARCVRGAGDPRAEVSRTPQGQQGGRHFQTFGPKMATTRPPSLMLLIIGGHLEAEGNCNCLVGSKWNQLGSRQPTGAQDQSGTVIIALLHRSLQRKM